MDLDDQANAMAGLQRDRTNQLLQQSMHVENNRAEAARVISTVEALLQDLKNDCEGAPFCRKLGLLSINELALKKTAGEMLYKYDFNSYYPVLTNEWNDGVGSLCGSSLELRRALANTVRDIHEFHASISAEVVGAYIESLELIRRQVPKEGWAAKLASITKNPSESPYIPASVEWKMLMNKIISKFEGIGFPFQKLFDKEKFWGIDDSILLLFTGVSGSPIDYDPNKNEFVVDKEFLAPLSKPLFEANGQLLEASSIRDTSAVTRCFLRDPDGDEAPYKNYLLGWEFGEKSGQSPREIQARKKSEDAATDVIGWVIGIFILLVIIAIIAAANL